MSRKRKSDPSKSNDSSDFTGLPDEEGHQSSGQSRQRTAMLAARVYDRKKFDYTRFDSSASSSTSSLPHELNPFLTSSAYIDYGDCNQICEYCDARFWFAERIVSSPLNQRPKYHKCCKAGQVRLQFPKEPPTSIKQLFESLDFLENIRAYNSMFAMTSFGAKVDESINCGLGPYVFRVEGQICHWLGSLCPAADVGPRFLQMYIFGTEHEVSNRLRFFNEREKHTLHSETVQLLIEILNNINELVRLFRTAKDLCLSTDVPDFTIHLYNATNQINYDNPTKGTIGAIVYDNEPVALDFDIVIHMKDGSPQRINRLHPLYMTLQFPLLFVFGEHGWSPELRLLSDTRARDRQLTMNMFYSYQLHDRINLYTLLLRSGRLFQQYLVDAYICIEQNRLGYIQSHQNLFRNEFLQGIHDALLRGDSDGRDVGKRTVLPASFTGGPRYMYKHYQDALAICRVHGNPQYFITFTCNVRWPEIRRYLAEIPFVKVQDRPDIIAKVLQMKVEAFINYLKSAKPFVHVVADLYTIEFQKRGLPHCHTLLWVTPPHKIQSPEQVDRFISAVTPDPVVEPTLYRIVTESMMHGPCGLPKMNAPCMSNDNAHVVPYNKNLCLHFDAHINVEYCGWSMMIKYLFKYISKGADRIRFKITNSKIDSDKGESNCTTYVDEIKNFVDGRFICPHEAAWRIFDFPIHNRNPSVQVLAVHLENMQNITFKDSQRLHNIVNNPSTKQTTLTEWLYNNCVDETGRNLRYLDYLSEYKWNSAKFWSRRTSNRTPAIGRLIYIHPTCGESFYLRMLLGHQTGCRSFVDIKTVDGIIFPTYRAACEKLGLLGDDKEWTYAFDEASVWATPLELRSLFTHMLLFCEISNPLTLWKEQWRKMSDDIVARIGSATHMANVHVNDNGLEDYVLYEIELLLNSSASSSTLSNFGLPMPRAELRSGLKNRLLMEEKNYDREKLAAEHEILQNALHLEQAAIYESVMKSCANNTQLLLFVYGHGGTGKTYLWNTIISALRVAGKIVLVVAASGIALLLLPSGRTAHSRFKIPLDLTDDSICYIKKNTQLAQLLLQPSLIIWDEASMNDRRCFEPLDKSLRDVLNNPTKLFGGKSILLGGDFRQTLPIKPKCSKSEIIAASFSKSSLWKEFKVCKLTENMRLLHPKLNSNDRVDIARLSSWLLSVDDGQVGVSDSESPSDTKNIEMPPEFLIQYHDCNIQKC